MKTLIGPQLRKLRRDRGETQMQMAQTLGVSASYINLLENNQRSLSVQMLLKLAEAYDMAPQDLARDDAATTVAELRAALSDPIFSTRPDLAELRAAAEHTPGLVDAFLHLHTVHRSAVENMLQLEASGAAPDLRRATPETVIHDFFRKNANYFPALEQAADTIRGGRSVPPEELYAHLKARLSERHGVAVRTRPIDDMGSTLRLYDEAHAEVVLSQALNHENRVFQICHMLALIEFGDLIDGLMRRVALPHGPSRDRCRVELANYLAAAVMMPYSEFLEAAETALYDLDRIASVFGVSFEQVCHRHTTMNRDGAKGVAFFFLRVDRAGNVTKRFNATTFQLAEYGGACPVWNIHTAFS
ncbi:MAG: ImmA/IrrE family metallo-endopeptidase, partial [Pseudomonadota bacterium]